VLVSYHLQIQYNVQPLSATSFANEELSAPSSIEVLSSSLPYQEEYSQSNITVSIHSCLCPCPCPSPPISHYVQHLSIRSSSSLPIFFGNVFSKLFTRQTHENSIQMAFWNKITESAIGGYARDLSSIKEFGNGNFVVEFLLPFMSLRAWM